MSTLKTEVEMYLTGPAHCSCCGGNRVEHDGPCCRIGF